MPRPRQPDFFSLRWRLVLSLLGVGMAGAALWAGLRGWVWPHLVVLLRQQWQGGRTWPDQLNAWQAWILSLCLLLPGAMVLARWMLRPWRRFARSLDSLLASYHDGDYGVSLVVAGPEELRRLAAMHNALGETLRTQRQALAQRELMLDTVVQNTPVALVLTDAQRRVVYANLAARHLFHHGASLTGLDFDGLLERFPAALLEAIARGEDALLSVELADEEEVFHLSQRRFLLQGRAHRLHLFRRMTRELSRQEVASWKRVIRVISHELNNSLAPISSLAHSGAELVRRHDWDRLGQVMRGIEERARHLHDFIGAYAQFAKLPAPRWASVEWAPFLQVLAYQLPFRQPDRPPAQAGWFDAGQIEQALINLLKNAHEAGGDPSAVELRIGIAGKELRLEVCDRGAGMSETVLAQALLPFYSTKRAGTGLGLALVREIAEAHGGRITLTNREGGGLRARLSLPQELNGLD